MQRAGILLETLEHVGLRVTKPMMRQPSYYVPCLSGENSPALASLFLSIDHAKEQNQNVIIYTCFTTPTPIKDSVGDGGVFAIHRFWPLDLHVTIVR